MFFKFLYRVNSTQWEPTVIFLIKHCLTDAAAYPLIPLIHTYRMVRRNSKCQPFSMCPGWSFQSPLLGTIYDTSLDNYIQWINANLFLSNRSPPQLIWIKQCLILPYRNTVQEAQTFVKMADICCYGVRCGNVWTGGKSLK